MLEKKKSLPQLRFSTSLAGAKPDIAACQTTKNAKFLKKPSEPTQPTKSPILTDSASNRGAFSRFSRHKSVLKAIKQSSSSNLLASPRRRSQENKSHEQSKEKISQSNNNTSVVKRKKIELKATQNNNKRINVFLPGSQQQRDSSGLARGSFDDQLRVAANSSSLLQCGGTNSQSSYNQRVRGEEDGGDMSIMFVITPDKFQQTDQHNHYQLQQQQDSSAQITDRSSMGLTPIHNRTPLFNQSNASCNISV